MAKERADFMLAGYPRSVSPGDARRDAKHGPGSPAAGPLLEYLLCFAAWLAGSLMLVVPIVGAAQDLRYTSHQHWSTEEGLPQSSVHAIAQTPDGFLWIATEDGLARFDGFNFKVFDGRTLPSPDICCLKVQGEDLLVGTAEGSVREHAGSFTSDPAHPLAGDALQREPAPNAGWSWSADGVSHVGAGGKERGWRVGNNLHGRVQVVLVDRAGLAWVGMKNGLVVLNPDDGSVTSVPALEGNPVLSLFEDAEGNHWIGTETTGLHVLRSAKFRAVPGLADLPVTSVVEATDGAVWVGTRDDGLRRVRAGRVDQPVATAKLSSAVILCLAPAAGGAVWVGTPDGLNYVSATGAVRLITSADGLPDDYIRSVATSSDGTAWIGTQHGLAHLTAGKVDKLLTAADGLAGDMVGALLIIPEGLLAGTSGGLSLVGLDGQVSNFDGKDQLGRRIVAAMARGEDGKLWVATKHDDRRSAGAATDVSVHPPGTIAGHTMVEVGSDQTLPWGANRTVLGMTPDRSGRLWFRLDRGIWLADAARTMEHAEGFGTADGLPTDEVVAGQSSAGWLAANGEMWFPTRRGVAVVDTAHIAPSSTYPPVVVERFLVDEAEVGDGIEIPFGHQRLTFEFAGLSFTAPSSVRYRYQLAGFDKAWTDGGSRRTATYTNLAPGHYVFEVQAMTGGGVWSRTGARIHFRIVPPYYRSWWFVLLMIGLLGLLLATAWLLRLRRIRQQFEAVLAERNRMAREIHDTLTQDFVGTSLQLDIVSQMLKRGKVEAALEQVVRTRRLVTEGLDEARQSIWELRATNAEDSLPTRMTRLVQREAFSSLAARLHVGGAYRALPPAVEREVLRITQEALSNTLKHAAATQTNVNLHYSDEALLLSIEDNGAGFVMDEAAQKAGHFGLIGMRERASVVDGEIGIKSSPGAGTTVTLRIPIGSEA